MPDPPTPLWYACYGSNLRAERFYAYLRGGPLPDGMGEQIGALDASPPSASAAHLAAWELRFGRHSSRWGGGAAFLIAPGARATPPRTPAEALQGGSLCRLYRITFEQFVDVFLQENDGDPHAVGRAAVRDALARTIEALRPGEFCDLPPGLLDGGWYRRVLHLGEREGEAILTFTADAPISSAPPSESYVRTITLGLHEAYPQLSEAQLASYLARCVRIPSSK